MVLSLGEKLRELRQQNQESLQQVADAIGASKAHLWELEAGKTKSPSLDLVSRLATHFKVTVSRLAGEEPDGDQTDDKSLVLYRAIRELPDADKELLETIIDGMKSRNQSDG